MAMWPCLLYYGRSCAKYCALTPSGLDVATVVAGNSPQPKAHIKERNHMEVTCISLLDWRALFWLSVLVKMSIKKRP